MKIIQAKNFIQKLRIYKLYRSAFPKCERKPFGVILKMQKAGKTDLWYVESDGKFIAMASTINGKRLILLDYFAVCRKSRGKGFGHDILTSLRKLYPGKGFFLEIEKTYPDADNAAERKRRKKFYLGCGMSELGTDAKLFGVDMELLGFDCSLSFDEYKEFYRINYGEFAAKNIKKL